METYELTHKIIIIIWNVFFSGGNIHNYYTKTRESIIATLLRQNNIAKYSKDCLCVLESPYFCLVRYLGVSYSKRMNDTANFARVIW